MPKRTKSDHDAIVNLYIETLNLREVSRRLGLHYNTVSKVVRRAKGKCVRCANPVYPGKQMCSSCAEHQRERMKTRRDQAIRQGKCVVCGKPRDPISRRYCSKHRMADILSGSAYQKRIRQIEIAKRKAGAPNVSSPPIRLQYIQWKYGDGGVEAWGRDEGLCQICGVDHADNKSVYLHHLDENKENNAADNLVCLCAPCHRLTHAILSHSNLGYALDWLKMVYPSLEIVQNHDPSKPDDDPMGQFFPWADSRS